MYSNGVPSAKKQEYMKAYVILPYCSYFKAFGNIVNNYVLNSRFPLIMGSIAEKVLEEIHFSVLSWAKFTQ